MAPLVSANGKLRKRGVAGAEALRSCAEAHLGREHTHSALDCIAELDSEYPIRDHCQDAVPADVPPYLSCALCSASTSYSVHFNHTAAPSLPKHTAV